MSSSAVSKAAPTSTNPTDQPEITPSKMFKVVVVGGTGQVGHLLVPYLESKECKVIVACPTKGINAQTGEGLEEAMKGAEVLIDVSNLHKWDSEEMVKFHADITNNCIKYGKELQHYVVLSIVGADKMAGQNVHMKAKHEQEYLVASSGLPYTIVRGTEFFEFTPTMAEHSEFHIPTALYQPMALSDVVSLLGDIALGAPKNGIVEIAGPEVLPMDQVVRDYFKAKHMKEAVEIVSTPGTKFLKNMTIDDTTLRPVNPDPVLGTTKFQDWLTHHVKAT